MKEQQYLMDLLKENDIVVFACSGGPDSMCLLSLLLNVRKNKKISLICAHINHKQRKESEEEFKFVKKYCEDKNIIFEGTEFTEYKKGNFEANAHQMRKDYFEKIIQKYNANYFMTAHHGDDLIETILMRLVRGSSLNGYMGFSKIEHFSNYSIVRPLITSTKEDILSYNNFNKIPYALDKSNEEDYYTRNRYRHHILPFLKQENKSVHLKFLNYQEKLCRIHEFLVKVVENALTDCVTNDNVHIVEFMEYEEVIQQMMIEKYLYHIYQNDIKEIKEVHVKNILNLIRSFKSNGKISLPLKKVGIKEYNVFRIIEQEKENSYCAKLEDNFKLYNGNEIKKIVQSKEKNNFVIRLNSEEITLPLFVRTRQNGDKIASKNMNGHQKLKDIFIDYKIPEKERNLWPIITDSKNEILWIPGLKKSKFDKEINEKYDIIYKYDISKEKIYVTKK